MKLTHTGLKRCAERRWLLLLVCLLAVCPGIWAQTDELNHLADIVKSLRTGGEKAYNEAIRLLAADKSWTPMDELATDRTVECKASDRVPGFRLNSILTNAENRDRYQATTGNHLNGADSRYSYSLYEKTLKAGKTASFSLPERSGEQVILIIPYSGEKAKLTASATGSGPFTVTGGGNGSLRLTGRADRSRPLSLSVTNGSGESVSYVVINYNSRK